MVQLAEEAQLLQAYGHEGGRHGEVCADVLLALQRLLDLREPLLVVVEVFLVIDGDALFVLEPLDEIGGHVSGPVGDPQRAGGRLFADHHRRPPPLLELHAARKERTEDGRRGGGSAAADEAPAGGAVGREAGEEPGIDSRSGHGDCAFRGFRGKGDGLTADRHESSSISSRSSVVGMSAAGSTSEASGAQLT